MKIWIDPVYGFIIRNRHGIQLYGTNTQVQGIRGGLNERGARTETTFSFNCWLAPDLYSISIAVHSPNAVSFDWLDGALFFRVISDYSDRRCCKSKCNRHYRAYRRGC